MLEVESNAESLQDKKLSNGIKRKDVKGKKREKYIPTSEPLELPFCRICGKRASGIHFGVYSCEACKVINFCWKYDTTGLTMLENKILHFYIHAFLLA